MSEALKQLLMVMVVVIGGMRSAMTQASSSSPGVLLQSGIEKEDVDGDVKTAMTIYEKLATDASAPREVRAKALLRLAGCDEKLGKQAKQVYEQIVREYSDQPAAVQARTRLTAIRQHEHPAAPTTMNVRKIDSERLGSFGPEDTDGHRATYIGPDGNLYFGDISGHAKNLVYAPDPDSRVALGWEVSRDFSLVALMLPKTKTRPATLAVTKTDGTGYRELLRDDEQGNILGGSNAFPVRWSWDNRSLVIHFPASGNPIYTHDHDTCTRLWIISIADGARRELLHENSTGCIARATFSPDGQFVAYEVWPIAFPQAATSKVFVVPIHGGEPHLIYESDLWPDNRFAFDALADWSADGRYLAVKGIHEGRRALFLLPMKGGATNGSPIFVRAGDFGDAWSTLSGSLIFMDQGNPAWHLASIDPDGKIGNWTQIEPNHLPFPTLPSFSPDANQIAYPARGPDSSNTDLVVKDLATGREKVIYRSNPTGFTCQYSADRPIVFCSCGKGRLGEETDLVSVSVDSGAVEQIATFPDGRYLLRHPQDGEIFYFAKIRNKGEADPKVRWDRSTQTESAVADAAEIGDYAWNLSLDGRWILRQRNGDLSFRPAAEGEWKTLVSGIENFNMLGSTPDGNWAVYIASNPQGHPGIYEAPLSGGEPRRVGDLPDNFRSPNGFFVFSPDGRKILAIDFGIPKSSLWILDNFEPETPK